MLSLALLFAVLGISAVQCTVCKTDADCGAGECCYIQPEFMVVSRRQVNLNPIHVHHDTGVCEAYHQTNASCFPLETANGHCGCTPGTSCSFVPAPSMTNATGPIRRRSIYMPGPGTFNCVVKSP